MVRDRDVRRWGRGVAITMIVLAIVCLGGALYSKTLFAELERDLILIHESDDEFLLSLPDNGRRAAEEKFTTARRNFELKLLNGFGFVILIAGIAICFILLSHAAISWKAYELAQQRLGNPSPNTEGE